MGGEKRRGEGERRRAGGEGDLRLGGGEGDLRRRGGEGLRPAGEGLRLFLGEPSRCLLLGDEGEWLRRLLTSPFLAAPGGGPATSLFGLSSSDEEEEPVSEDDWRFCLRY